MAFNVSQFRDQLVSDGARANLFKVSLNIPGETAANQKMEFMAKSAQIPGSTIGVAPLYYFGREVKFPGNVTFADWTVTIINDEDYLIRKSLERWMSGLGSHTTNMRANDKITAAQYSIDASVVQYSKSGDEAAKYNFVGMFPIDMSPIELDWGTNDSIEEFTVTFAYQYWVSA